MGHIPTADESGGRHSAVWVPCQDRASWILAETTHRAFPDRTERAPRCEVGTVDFDAATGTLEQVGRRGRATVEPLDPDRAEPLMGRSCRADGVERNPDRFGDPRTGTKSWCSSASSRTVVARDQSYDPPASNSDSSS